ncbi:MAG: DUF2065 domain-containing protein [Porticoccaceae bacterium]|jgi:uncharacterized protein YjeT (DUF2065 family)|nr:DUF2065 domain-containing protein [Porticoccaceae bacterium]
MLKDVATAICLMLVLEGIMPFLSPSRWRSMVEVIATVDDRKMRRIGLLSMTIGAVALFFIR